MDLYAELGIEKTADDATVKRAYRSAAHRSHPDKGGKSEVFHKIQRAYEVLSDPERRRRYDETGDYGQPPDVKANQMQAIAGMVLVAIEHCPDLDQTDVMAMVRQGLTAQMQGIRNQRAPVEAKIKKLGRALARFKVRGDGPNMIAQVLEGQIDLEKRNLEAIENNLAQGDALLEILADYEYTFEARTTQTLHGYFQQQGAGVFPY